MARFKYLGEPPFSFVQEIGPTTKINLKKKDGTIQTIDSPPGGFVINEDIGVEITDERSLRQLRADTARFLEI